MDNQMIIILAILLLFFMKNKKEKWHNGRAHCSQRGRRRCATHRSAT